VAKLFRATAEAETIHALNHLKVMGGIRTTKENVREAIEGEKYENEKMYPEFIEHAKNKGNGEAERTFTWANEVEKIHQNLFEKALESLEKGKDAEPKEYYVCQTCGNTVEGEPPEKCPICGMPGSGFRRVE